MQVETVGDCPSLSEALTPETPFAGVHAVTGISQSAQGEFPVPGVGLAGREEDPCSPFVALLVQDLRLEAVRGYAGGRQQGHQSEVPRLQTEGIAPTGAEGQASLLGEEAVPAQLSIWPEQRNPPSGCQLAPHFGQPFPRGVALRLCRGGGRRGAGAREQDDQRRQDKNQHGDGGIVSPSGPPGWGEPRQTQGADRPSAQP